VGNSSSYFKIGFILDHFQKAKQGQETANPEVDFAHVDGPNHYSTQRMSKTQAKR